MKKTLERFNIVPASFLFLPFGSYAYCAFAVSAAAVSAAAVSTAVVSSAGASEGLLPSPQDAKEIAAIATNIKTNFFIFFAFLKL